MKTNSELKNRAIDALTGNWGLGAVITLVYGLVMNTPTLALSYYGVGGFVLL